MDNSEKGQISEEKLHAKTKEELKQMSPKDIVILALRKAIEEDRMHDDSLTRPLDKINGKDES